MTFGQKILQLRKEKKISQIDIANGVGVSRDSISKYERDEMMPTVDKANKIASILGVSLDFLVSNELQQEAVDNKMMKRIKEIQKLPLKEQEQITSIMDAFVRDYKTRQAYEA